MANSEQRGKFREPPQFKITDQTKLEDWKNWLKSFRWYAGATNLSNRSHEEQISIFKSLVGPDAMKIYDTFSLLDITDVESVIQKFDEHFTPKVNVTVERLKFNRMTQRPQQSFEEFLAEVTTQAEKCNFASLLHDFLLDKIVVGISDDDVRTTLLAEENLNYEKALNICKVSAKKHFMSKINIGVKEVDREQDVSKHKPRKSSIAAKPVKNQLGDAKKVKKPRQSVEIAVPKLSVVTRKSARKLNSSLTDDKKHDGETDEALKSAEGDDNGSVKGADAADQNGEGDVSDDDWKRDEEDLDDDNDDDDKTFMPKVKLRVKKTSDLMAVKRKRRPAPKIVIPPGERPFACHHCGFNCANKGYIRKHMVIHTAEKLYACDQCDYKSIRPQGLFRHKFRHTGEKPYACEICEFRCSHQSSLKKHIMGHTGEKPHACDLCDYRAIVADKLRMHRMKHHTGEKPFKCASCPFACTHKGNLKNHMLTHSETRPFACDVCDRRFNSNFHLKQHTLTHTGERPYACHVCDFRSAQLGGLRTHMKRHTGEKPHVCHVCGHRTSLKGNLKKHMLTHTGERPYACTICAYRSAQSSGLKTHMKVHTGEKPYVCDMCGYRCATNGNLKQHMKTHKNHRPAAAEPPQAEVAPPWHEPFGTVNPVECAEYPNQDQPQQQPVLQAVYVACQSAQRQPVIAERRSVLQREWTNQNSDPNPVPPSASHLDPNLTHVPNPNLQHNQIPNIVPNPNLGHAANLNHAQNLNSSHNATRCAIPNLNHSLIPSLNHGQNPNVKHTATVDHTSNHILGVSHSQNHDMNIGQNANPNVVHNQHHLIHNSDQGCCAARKDSGMFVSSSGP